MAGTNASILSPGVESNATPRLDAQAPARTHPLGRAIIWILVTAIVAALLLTLSARINLAPDISADNAYIFLAADRLYEGHGLTATPPRAPLQPWTWTEDWRFLTQWPAGYPALLCATRFVTGAPTTKAAVILGVVCCAVAIVAWFAWIHSCLPQPRRLPAFLIAAVGAFASFSASNLVNPTSDGVLLALTPVVLLLAGGVMCREAKSRPVSIAALGLFAGSLVWLRYAAVFVPLAVGVYLLVECFIAGRAKLRHVFVYAVTSVLPIAALLYLNRTMSTGGSVQQQLNLGSTVGFDFNPDMLAALWAHFTEQTLYAYRPEAKWVFVAFLPIAAVITPMLWRSTRKRSRAFFTSPGVLLSTAAVVTLLAFLLAASVLFHDKYNYVGQSRYYQPIRPLYFLLFTGPLLALPQRSLRAIGCIPLIAACAWFANQDALRTITRWQRQPRPATDYGRWARRFEPNSAALYRWLAEQRGDDLVVFSNFHEEIALETQIPACPTPADQAELAAWCDRIRKARGVANLRVLFVLDPDNDYREYYLAPPADIVHTFDLTPASGAPGGEGPYVFVAADTSSAQERGPGSS